MKAAPFFTLIKGKAKLIGGALTLLSVVGTYLWIGHLNNKIEALEDDVLVYQTRANIAAAVNVTNQDTITSLRAANESFATALVVREDERIKAIKEAAERDARANAQLDSTLTEMERLRNANPTCEQLSQVDMGAVCPLVVERLRQHAAGTIDQD